MVFTHLEAFQSRYSKNDVLGHFGPRLREFWAQKCIQNYYSMQMTQTHPNWYQKFIHMHFSIIWYIIWAVINNKSYFNPYLGLKLPLSHVLSPYWYLVHYRVLNMLHLAIFMWEKWYFNFCDHFTPCFAAILYSFWRFWGLKEWANYPAKYKNK